MQHSLQLEPLWNSIRKKLKHNQVHQIQMDLEINWRSFKSKKHIGWVAENDLASMVKDMIHSDVKLVQKEQYLKAGDYHLSTNLE